MKLSGKAISNTWKIYEKYYKTVFSVEVFLIITGWICSSGLPTIQVYIRGSTIVIEIQMSASIQFIIFNIFHLLQGNRMVEKWMEVFLLLKTSFSVQKKENILKNCNKQKKIIIFLVIILYQLIENHCRIFFFPF